MTPSALVLGSRGFGNEPLHKIRYGVREMRESHISLQPYPC